MTPLAAASRIRSKQGRHPGQVARQRREGDEVPEPLVDGCLDERRTVASNSPNPSAAQDRSRRHQRPQGPPRSRPRITLGNAGAHLVIDSTNGAVAARLEIPNEVPRGQDGEMRPTHLMEVPRYVELTPDATGNRSKRSSAARPRISDRPSALS